MEQIDGPSLTAVEMKMAEAVEYYLSIGCTWCFIEKNMGRKRVELERLCALARKDNIRRNENA